VNDDTDYTAVEEAFFHRGELLEQAPAPPVDPFDDLEPRPPRRRLSPRSRGAAIGAAVVLALCTIALAVPNDDSPAAASLAQSHEPPSANPPLTPSAHPEQAERAARSASKGPAPAPAPALAPAPAPALAPAPSAHPEQAERAARSASKGPSAHPEQAERAARSASKGPQAHRPKRADRKPAPTESKRPRARRDSKRGKKHYDLGLRAWKRGDLATARKEFLAATRVGHAPGHRALGIVYRKLGKTPQAIRAFRTYLRVSPKSADAAKVRRTLAQLERS
jgi:hypothetical protein